MTSTHRICRALLLLGFGACGVGKMTGTVGAGGESASGGAGGSASGGGGAWAGAGGGEATGGGHGGRAGSAGGAAGHGNGGAGGNGGQAAPCVFSATYTINDGGGLVSNLKTTILSPPAKFVYQHYNSSSGGPLVTCSPDLPACGSAGKIDVSDIEAAMANADVQGAFAAATEPAYGERNVADGPRFEVVRSTGGGFVVGLECTTASSTCLPTPAGVHAVVQLLRDLVTQQALDLTCDGVI